MPDLTTTYDLSVHFDWSQGAVARGACGNGYRSNRLTDVTCEDCRERLAGVVGTWMREQCAAAASEEDRLDD